MSARLLRRTVGTLSLSVAVPNSQRSLGYAVALVVAAGLVGACGRSEGPTAPGGTPATTTLLEFVSDSGEFVGQGRSYRYALADGPWSSSIIRGRDGAIVVIEADYNPIGLGPYWRLHLDAPEGRSLGVGDFPNARRVVGVRGPRPGLDFSGSGRGCDDVTGHFAITDLVLGAGDRVDRLRVTFEQHCEGRAPALKGAFAIAANPWR